MNTLLETTTPDSWVVKRLDYLVGLTRGESNTSDAIFDKRDLPVYGGNGLRDFTSSYTREGETVLIGRQGALRGNINFADGKFWASEHAIVAPPKSEHELIVAAIAASKENSAKLTDSLVKSITLLKERHSSLITAAVTGQIPLEEMKA